MVTEGGGGCGESVMRPRGALCGCCENTVLWDVETVFIWMLALSGPVQAFEFF